jgi:micrococcal nuclease
MKFIIIFIFSIFLSLSGYSQINDFTTVTTNYCYSGNIASTNYWRSAIQFDFYHKAKVVKVVDGDTVDMLVDLGFNVKIQKRFRLFGINAPEMKNDKDNNGHKSKEFLTKLIQDKEVVIKTEDEETDKYGRYIVTIYLDGININKKIVENGEAVYKNY